MTFSLALIAVLVVLQLCFTAKGVGVAETRQSHAFSSILHTHGSQIWDIPPLDHVHMSHEDGVHYAVNTPIGVSEWNATLPSGGSLLHLGPTLSKSYTLSVFHQLRCLNIIREAIVDFYADTSADDPYLSERQRAIITHCMNYVRQMILCRADMRLENVRAPNGTQMTASDITHTCKDWTAVYQAAEENHRSFRDRYVEYSSP